jgi:transcriptional regulator with XRE-family HTH domain
MIPASEVTVAPAPANETFGSRIRRRRREKGLSQRQLAAQVGIDFTYLSKLENNQSGQSPGEDLIGRLAQKLEEDPEDLLALAGKVPVDELRARAREDPEFARSLRRLPPDSRITGLIAPPTEMAAITDAHVLAILKRSPGICSFRSDFITNQDEYLVGIVGQGAHRDRLREANLPLHDIFVPYPEEVDGAVLTGDIARRYGISVEFRDSEAGGYVAADLERLEATSAPWQAQVPHDIPLAVLRARFPPQTPDQVRRIALVYGRFRLLTEEEGYWFWMASRPMFVSTITVDATDLERTNRCRLEKFLPNIDSEEEKGGRHVVNVSAWLLKGHGVMLSWWTITDRAGG